MTTVKAEVVNVEEVEEVKELTAAEKRKATLAAKKEAQAKEVKVDKPSETVSEKTVEIVVDKITCGKSNIFNFTFKGKRILTPFFVDIIGNEYYGSDHHVNGERLDQLGAKFPDYGTFAFGSETPFEQYKTITPNSHNELMKYTLAMMVQDGVFSTDHNNATYKMVWKGEKLVKPTLKHQAEKKERKEKQVTANELAGLDFTSMF